MRLRCLCFVWSRYVRKTKKVPIRHTLLYAVSRPYDGLAMMISWPVIWLKSCRLDHSPAACGRVDGSGCCGANRSGDFRRETPFAATVGSLRKPGRETLRRALLRTGARADIPAARKKRPMHFDIRILFVSLHDLYPQA